MQKFCLFVKSIKPAPISTHRTIIHSKLRAKVMVSTQCQRDYKVFLHDNEQGLLFWYKTYITSSSFLWFIKEAKSEMQQLIHKLTSQQQLPYTSIKALFLHHAAGNHTTSWTAGYHEPQKRWWQQLASQGCDNKDTCMCTHYYFRTTSWAIGGCPCCWWIIVAQQCYIAEFIGEIKLEMYFLSLCLLAYTMVDCGQALWL